MALGEFGEGLPDEGSQPRFTPAPGLAGPVEPIELRYASFDDLRSLGLSVTQATRVLERVAAGEVTSPDDLACVPGIPRRQLVELKLALGG
jgi:hypothetical protein